MNDQPPPPAPPSLHHLLDVAYDPARLEALLEQGADLERPAGPHGERALHVAVRRRRLDAVERLLDHGAAIDATTAGGKTAYGLAACRPFPEIVRALARRGADTTLTPAEVLIGALLEDELPRAAEVRARHPEVVTAMGPEDARILGDLASQGRLEGLAWLLDAGLDIASRGLDGGTALHTAAWFGQPRCCRLLLERGAPLDVICTDHRKTPLGWAAHGSRWSGGAQERQDVYVDITEQLLAAGSSLADPLGAAHDPHGRRLLEDASPAVAEVLRRHGARE